MNIDIREYEKNDFDQVNSLLIESFSVPKKDVTGDFFCEFVATIGSEVVGYLLLTKVLNPILDRYYYLVDYVCVDSEYRRLGVGKKLLEEAYDFAKKQSAIYLQLTCSTFRIAAHKLYESCGFVKRESDIFRKEII